MGARLVAALALIALSSSSGCSLLFDPSESNASDAAVEADAAVECALKGWSRRTPISLDNADLPVPSEELIDFPVLITLKTGEIEELELGDTGEDIRFTDLDGNLLAHEIDAFSPSAASIWVRVPSIAANSEQIALYLYGGRPGAQDSQEPADVWGNGHTAVYHMSVDTSNRYINSITGLADGVPNGEVIAVVGSGAIGGMASIRGSTDDYVEVPDQLGQHFATEFTIEGRLQPSQNTPQEDRLLAGKGSAYRLVIGTAAQARLPACSLESGADGVFQLLSMESLDDNTDPHYVACTYNTNDKVIRIYVNGAKTGELDISAKTDASTLSMSPLPLVLGRAMIGNLDEFRLSEVQRGAGWISAQARNLNGSFARLFASEGCL